MQARIKKYSAGDVPIMVIFESSKSEEYGVRCLSVV
jgi:hypothetical protein